MVVPKPIVIRSEKINEAIELPIIDLSMGERSEISKHIVKACEEFGFFKVINHGVPNDIISNMEQESLNFFAKPLAEKQLAGPPNPFGYGLKKIGFNGDMGELEYILLHTNPNSIAQHSNTISNDPTTFRCVVSWYIEAVKRLGSEILDLIGEGLKVSDPKMLSRLIHDSDNDSVLRLNHYPNSNIGIGIGIGEHSDPQILTILTSNDVPGLQISLRDDEWVPVPPDPTGTAFLVNVGDLLQAMTNGRFVSVRHRALTNTHTHRSRMSMAYFAAPPLSAWIQAPKELVPQDDQRLYRPFTWADYKNTTFSLRLGDTRLHLFKPTLSQPLN